MKYFLGPPYNIKAQVSRSIATWGCKMWLTSSDTIRREEQMAWPRWKYCEGLRDEKWEKRLMTALCCLGHCKMPSITQELDICSNLLFGAVKTIESACFIQLRDLNSTATAPQPLSLPDPIVPPEEQKRRRSGLDWVSLRDNPRKGCERGLT